MGPTSLPCTMADAMPASINETPTWLGDQP
jgi:hypothetical protein